MAHFDRRSKALDIDSSLSARNELAKELDYTGGMNDSAAMNILAAQTSHGQGCSQRRQELPPEIKHA